MTKKVIDSMDLDNVKYEFTKDTRYVTRGINADIPIEIQVLLWGAVDVVVASTTESDYLQVFTLVVTKGVLRINHSQESPQYSNSFQIKLKNKYTTLDSVRIFVIDDVTHSTMLLANEY